jgi:glycosyltransferase involved in cell wall biosynthesis
LRPLLARADRLIGVSRFETEFFRRRLHLPAERFETITNGVSAHFLEVDSELLGQRTAICSVGRLERYKGHQRVIAALPEVRRHIPDVVLHIVGDGPYRRALTRLADRLGVGDIVHFSVIDPRERQQMADLFRSARLITLLSNYESQGVVGLEAIAVGRSLLVAEGTALAELGQYGDVSVIPPHVDASALGWLIARKIQQDLLPTRNLVPIWEETVDRLTAVYEDVLRERSERTVR